MKLIFLDIEGVLNSAGSLFYHGYLQWRAGRASEDTLEVGANIHFCPIAATALRVVLRECPSVMIVISSTWRGSSMEELRRLFQEHDLPLARIIDVTPRLTTGDRGDEIAAWLSSYNGLVEDFVILDDSTDMGNLRERHLVQTDPMTGLTMRQAISLVARFRGVPFDTVDKQLDVLTW